MAVCGTFILSIGFVTTGAAVYTSRSEFCISCHIMEPYYVSWQESSHSHVACIKCHFPPGAVEKVRGKMLGLVQLLKYVTATAVPRLSARSPTQVVSAVTIRDCLPAVSTFRAFPLITNPISRIHGEESSALHQLSQSDCARLAHDRDEVHLFLMSFQRRNVQ